MIDLQDTTFEEKVLVERLNNDLANNLGNLVSKSSDWTPLKNRIVYFKENPANRTGKDPWQFKNFLFID